MRPQSSGLGRGARFHVVVPHQFNVLLVVRLRGHLDHLVHHRVDHVWALDAHLFVVMVIDVVTIFTGRKRRLASVRTQVHFNGRPVNNWLGRSWLSGRSWSLFLRSFTEHFKSLLLFHSHTNVVDSDNCDEGDSDADGTDQEIVLVLVLAVFVFVFLHPIVFEFLLDINRIVQNFVASLGLVKFAYCVRYEDGVVNL